MDVWKIGVSIALSNQMSPVLAVIAADLLGLKGKVKEVETAFTAWKPALAGALAVIGGVAIIDGMSKIIDHGQELVHVQQQLAATGVTQVEQAQATAKAWEEASKYGLKVADVLGDIKESQMVFGSTEHAIDFIDPLEKMRVVLNSVTEGSGNKARDAVYEMARAGELKGLQGPDQFTSYFDMMTKAITASGGKVDPAGFLQATQYGKIASKGWSEEFYTKILPSMIQEMKPTTAGQSLMSLYGTLEQGKASARAVDRMDELGLFADRSKIKFDKLGNAVGFNPGAVVGSDLLTKNPYQWSQEILKPLMEKKLGYEMKPGDQGALDLLSGMFGNRNSAAAIASLLLENKRIDKDAGLIGRAHGIDEADNLLKNDPTAVMNNFKSSWDNLLTSLGAPAVSIAITALNSLADVMKSITKFAVANPTAIKLMAEAILGIGAALIAIGTGAMVVAAVMIIGPITAAVAAVGAVIATLVAFNWSALKDAFNIVKDAVTKVGQELIDGIKALPGMVIGAINSAMAAIGNAFVSAIKSIAGGGALQPGQVMPKNGPTGAPYVSPYSPGKQGSIGDIYMDHRKVGQIVGRGMVADAMIPNGPASSSSRSLFPTVDSAPAYG